MEQTWQKDDPDPKALACYGVLWQEGTVSEPVREEMSLRFVDGRPVSNMTTQFLEWCCTKLQKQGKTSWLLIWDNAPWHVSKMVRSWIRLHNRLYSDSGMGSQGSRRRRKLCKAQQISMTRSRTPVRKRRQTSLRIRQRLTLLLTCSMETRRRARA